MLASNVAVQQCTRLYKTILAVQLVLKVDSLGRDITILLILLKLVVDILHQSVKP